MPTPRFKTIAVTGAPLVSLDAIKAQLRLTQNEDDDLVMRLYSAGLALIEKICGRAFPQQTIKLVYDYFPEGGGIPWWSGVRQGALTQFQDRTMDLVRAPTISVTSLTTYDLNNAATVYDPANYFLSNEDDDLPGRICLNIGAIWPVSLRRTSAVEIIYEAGYADLLDETDPMNPVPYSPPRSGVPGDVILAITQLIAYLYEHRGEESSVSAPEDSGVMGWLRPYVFLSPMVPNGSEDQRSRLW